MINEIINEMISKMSVTYVKEMIIKLSIARKSALQQKNA